MVTTSMDRSNLCSFWKSNKTREKTKIIAELVNGSLMINGSAVAINDKATTKLVLLRPAPREYLAI